ncbi:DUF4167 domain-containing protein [Novosphingobium sp.]|uniref:DUF4167 domain-containing protein n=1 Tax=Novosphingobium sp. TaxID=1874826 RepID=UPI002735DC39|nr:DUF4167 domain-containing protein [Novosphingobium sp.]MDP3908262.1 DUF4167 domain-containing protein [Novosphingobium sp.]
MNNISRGNNNNNNRRRGRSNRPGGTGGGGGGGGGQQQNRIDSRARGNAPQLLEKYRKLAQDAHLNGDRVQAEYYLQFADHYFRVIADARVRQEEQRKPRDERWPDAGDEGDDSGEFHVDNDFPAFDPPANNRPPREERVRRAERDAREEREDRDERDERPSRAEPVESAAPAVDEVVEANPFESPENPFVRENRGTRGLRPRREDRLPRRDERPAADDAEPAGLDPASLPPAISARREEPVADAAADAEAKPKRPRVRRKPAADGAGEALESVG